MSEMARRILPKNWKKVLLGDISNNISYGYTASSTNKAIGPRMLRITDIQNNSVNWDSVPFCEIDVDEIDKYLLLPNDIVFARTGATVGKSFLIPNNVSNSVYASYLIRVRLTEGVDPKYISYFFQSGNYWRQIKENQVGIGQPNVNGSKLKKIEIPLAPYQEQKQIIAKIEELFSHIDAGVEGLKKTQRLLKQYRQSVLKAAVTGELTREWREKHGVSYEGKWGNNTLGDVAEIIDPNPSHRYPSYDNGTIPLLATKQMDGDDCWDASTAKLTNQDFYEERKAAHAFKEDDIIFARKGRLGLARFPPKLEKYAFSHTVFIVRKKHKVSSEFLLWLLRQDSCVSWLMEEINCAAGVPTLGKAILQRLPIKLPSLDEQIEIVRIIDEKLSSAECCSKIIDAQLLKAERNKQSILTSVFMGRLS